MDTVMKDEEKPFDLGGPPEDNAEPDPTEEIMLKTGTGRVWLVKIPRFLMERWSAIDEDNKELARIRIYDNNKPHPPRIFVIVPSDPSDPSAGDDTYELDMQNQDVENQIVVAEREKERADKMPTRARTTIMTGKVKHECNLRPTFTQRYRERVKESTLSSMPRKSVKMMEEVATGVAGKMAMNRLTSGMTSAGGFAGLTRPKPRPAKGEFQRMARIPRNQLLDMLFGLYRERSHWPIKQLRERTQQPEAYLKDVLSEIASLHRSGEYNGMWELKPAFLDGAKSEATAELYASQSSSQDVEMFYEDDEDDDEEMEEIS